MGTYNPNRTRPALIGIRTTNEQKELFIKVTELLGKNNGETFDLMVDLMNLIINDQDVTLEDVRGLINGNK